jgi:hypothetical protein
MNPNTLSFGELFQYITLGINQYQGMFITYGLILETAFATILFVIFGAQTWLRGAVQWEKLVRLIVGILAVHTILINYQFFTHLITSEMQFLANQINGTLTDQVVQRLYVVYRSMETPSIATAVFSVVEVATYLIILGCIIAAAASIYAVISLSFVLQAVSVLTGPILIPWVLFPIVNKFAWGWLQSLVVNSFIQVTAAAYLFTAGQALIVVVDRAGTDLSAPELAKMLFVYPVTFLAFAYGMFKIPSYTNDKLSGRGGYTVWGS